MLKSFDYVENTAILATDSSLLDEERSIASSFLTEHVDGIMDQSKACPACDDLISTEFMVVLGIKYKRCNKCKSIFALVNTELCTVYETFPKLVEFKQSSRYINSQEGKSFIWEEWLLWIHFRVARYLGRNESLKVYDHSNTFTPFSALVKKAPFCDEYNASFDFRGRSADLVIYMDTISKEAEPLRVLKDLKKYMADDGILAVGGRVGSGFDILTLKEHNRNIFPLKYVFLPSTKGFELLLNRAGYNVLEMSTPGALDVNYVLQMKDAVQESFLSHFLEYGDTGAFSDFQRFLQKNGLSSYSRIIAQSRKE